MSTGSTSNIFAWVHEDEERLEQEGGQKLVIVEGINDFWRAFHNDFTQADAAITRAIEAAHATGELRWQLFLRHWRLQLRLSHDLKWALPEAIDLLTLAEDERLRDVPQRICAYHDVVDCHVRMDARGYHDDIVANSLQVLDQLPKRHPCADCARIHLAMAEGALGATDAATQWIARFYADAYDRKWIGGLLTVGEVYEQLERWGEAEETFERAGTVARQQEDGEACVSALLGLASARVGKSDVSGAQVALAEARHFVKYVGAGAIFARLLAVESRVARAADEQTIADDYQLRAARQYLALGQYRHAATLASSLVERLGPEEAPTAEEALTIAARAVGQMPETSHDAYARLRALGREPTAPTESGVQEPGSRDAAQDERIALEELLAAHITHGYAHAVATVLYRLGRWHAQHEQPRAALDYLISNAILERALTLPLSDREDALGALMELETRLPTGTVQSALAAAERGPSSMLEPLLAEVPAPRWQWLVRCVATELAGKPVIEPEPEGEESDDFEGWVNHVAPMVALVLRFRDQSAPEKRARWTQPFDEMAAEISAQMPDEEPGKREILSLVGAFAALCREGDPAVVAESVLPPFDELVRQIIAISQEPVWEHPGMWPLDYLVEDAAQRAVRALRIHDEHRSSRLQNLAFRYELMAIDLRTNQDIWRITQFIEALRALVLDEGKKLPHMIPPLEEPFDAILQGVYDVSTPSSKGVLSRLGARLLGKQDS